MYDFIQSRVMISPTGPPLRRLLWGDTDPRKLGAVFRVPA